MAHLTIVDNANDTRPAVNLALEEYIVRELDASRDYLVIYRNQPSIIIGKHQNPFQEVNYRFIQKSIIPVFRRMSGGGTVYHDPGNINFSFITCYSPQQFNTYHNFVMPVVDLLNELGVPAILNQRNDITVNGLKISGNAQFTSREKLLCHGTLLFDANLDILKKALKVENHNIYSKSTRSVRSPVTNLSSFPGTAYPIDTFRKILTERLADGYSTTDTMSLTAEQWEKLGKQYVQKYSSWEWNYGRTPKFSVTGLLEDTEIELFIEEGRIRQILQEPSNSKWTHVLNYLIGKPYMPHTLEEVLLDLPDLSDNEKKYFMNIVF